MKKKVTSSEVQFHLIDPTRLDEEWSNQIRWVEQYGKQLADAKQALEEAKTAYAVKEADVSKKIRKRPDRYDLDKITEAAVKETMTPIMADSQEYTDWVEAKHRVDVLQATMATLDNRKKAVEDNVFLFSIQYFAEPRKKARKDVVQDMVEKKAFRSATGRGKKKRFGE